ncbi:DUF4198 domain-containing protein [Campylobacter suis]|uniref:DUF4198 domain-containing protein n=1 Tax=Campylobacter suis TaxID=2790657 RepID=A0ABM8Q791_9BACT|nr:DUF4198 domain-containing protein [Campylobacter suis]CAD7288683.1 hypothetical protein LMG8286_01451 [Campylobacter suis]
MKKTLICLAVAGLVGTSMAHDFWVDGKNEDKFNAHIGYGHDFPTPEKISEKRVKLFDPLYIVKQDGSKVKLNQSGENYEFSTEKLADASYILAGDYKPTFWSQDSDGKWHMDKTRKDVKNVEFCEVATMAAKRVISIGDKKHNFIHSPIGQSIEIVPLSDPFELKVDKPFKVQVFLDGKPLKTAKVTGTFDGFLKDKHAFSGTTDLKGVIEILALKPGKWLLEVTHERPYKDKEVCDVEMILATLVVNIK